MFLGTTLLTLDAKGRIAIPARYRASIKESCEGKLVIAYNPLDDCLPVYPAVEWEECLRKMQAVKDKTEDFRAMQRHLFANSDYVDMDSAGRMLVPQRFRDRIGLDKNAVLIGHGEKFEVWSEERWLQNGENDDADFIKRLKSRTERLDIGFDL